MAFPTGKPPAPRGVGTPLRREYEDLPSVLDKMAELVREHRSANLVRDTAAKISQDVPAKDAGALARAVWTFVRSEIQYVLDPAGTELLQGPDVTLRKGYGDCDDQAILAAALLMALGVDAGFRAVAQVEAGDFDHVYVLYWSSGQWKELDTIGGDPPGSGPFFPGAQSTLNKIIEGDMPEAKRGRDLGLTIGPPGGGFPGGGLPFVPGPGGGPGGGFNLNPGGGPGGGFNFGGGGFNFDPGGQSFSFGGQTFSASEFGLQSFDQSAPGRSGSIKDQIIDLLRRGIEVTPAIIRAIKGGEPIPGYPGGGGRPGGGNQPGGGSQPGGGTPPGSSQPRRRPTDPVSTGPTQAGIDTNTALIGGGVAVGVLALILQQTS